MVKFTENFSVISFSKTLDEKAVVDSGTYSIRVLTNDETIQVVDEYIKSAKREGKGDGRVFSVSRSNTWFKVKRC